MRLQEEVENRTVNLAVNTTKATARTIIRALRWYLMGRNQRRMRKAMQHEEGKQSVQDLMKGVVSTDKIELPDGSAKDFSTDISLYKLLTTKLEEVAENKGIKKNCVEVGREEGYNTGGGKFIFQCFIGRENVCNKRY